MKFHLLFFSNRKQLQKGLVLDLKLSLLLKSCNSDTRVFSLFLSLKPHRLFYFDHIKTKNKRWIYFKKVEP